MANSTKVLEGQEIKSMKDAGYQHSKVSSRVDDIVTYIMGHAKNFGNPDIARSDQLTDNQRNELKSGYMIHYGELSKGKERYYLTVDRNLVETDKESFEKHNGEKRKLNLSIAFGMTQAILNDAKKNDKDWYDLVQELKTDFNRYFSNRVKDLIDRAIEMYKVKHDIKRQRVQAFEFQVFEQKHMAELEKRVRNADSRGNDPSADVALVKRRIAAYWAAK